MAIFLPSPRSLGGMEHPIDWPEDDAIAAQLRRDGPMNRARAQSIMARHDLAGLVLGQPVNVYHALGHWPQIARTRVGQPPTTFALIARDPPGATGLVTSRFLHYYTWADGHDRPDVQAWLYSDIGDGGSEETVAETDPVPDRGHCPLSSVEARRHAALQAVDPAHRSFVDAGAALVRAIRDMGMWGGRIGYDDPVVAAVAQRHDHPGTLVAADNVLREIRVVKSPLEQALMRRAASANVVAMNAVCRAVQAGAGYRDLQRLYAIETARQGNQAVFLNVDRVSSDLTDARIRDGQALFLDGVSQYRGYHGDYARTVFVGEPGRDARRAAEAAAFGWQAVRERLRPGIRYSEIVRIGQEAVRRAGYEATIGFGPHSVGLSHTDEPGDVVGGFYRKPDLVLEEDMILSVDCPVLDVGIGGSAHCEDLVRIVADGAEPIHPLHDPVVVL